MLPPKGEGGKKSSSEINPPEFELSDSGLTRAMDQGLPSFLKWIKREVPVVH